MRIDQSVATMQEALAAAGPHPDHIGHLMLFGQFVGAWDLDWTGWESDGSTRTAVGEWHFGWVLEGRAVQDVWIVPSRAARAETGAAAGEYGTTIRFYDPRLEKWRITWNGPVNGAVRTFTAARSGDEIVLEGTSSEGLPMRWIFSDITPTSFR
ncbi:MAG TPA: hypothetical protein VJU79_04440, partial [Candidatus Dormibacteraeota bacterium]|nr:hypothetical protein [Candidatus Dormibacteraeota bacterium]